MRRGAEINFQKYVDLNCAKLWSLTSEAPLKGHPQGVPCAELAVRSTDWGVTPKSITLWKRSHPLTTPPSYQTSFSKTAQLKKIHKKEDLGIAKDTISSQEKEIKHLNVFKNLWNKFMKFFKNRVRYYADESYKKVYETMNKNKILRQDDMDYIDNKNVKK